MANGIQMLFGKEHFGFAIRQRPSLISKVIEPLRTLGTSWRLGHFDQLTKLFGSMVKLKHRGMLGLGHGKVFHYLVVIVTSNHIADN